MTADMSRENNNIDTQTAIFNDLIKILFKNILISVPASFICSTIVFLAITYHANSTAMLTWYGGMILVSLGRLISLFLYTRHYNNAHLYRYYFLIGVTLNAALWGILDSVLMPHHLILQMVVIVIIAGITAGGAQTLMASLLASVINLFVMMIPLCLWIYLQNDPTYYLLNIAMLSYMFFMFIASVRNNQILLKTMQLHYDNLELVSNLSSANSKLFQSYKMLEKHENELAEINKFNNLLQPCKELKESYSIIRNTASELFTGFNGGLTIFDDDTNTMELITEWGHVKCMKLHFKFQDCIALRTGKEYHVNDTQTAQVCDHIHNCSSYICLPLYGQYGVIGSFTLYSLEKQAFNNYIIQLVHSFIEAIQLNIINITLRESLYEQSIHDPLTGLFNRRHLDTILSAKIARSIDDDRKMCVAMMDLDHFKRINDTYGHDAGDEILKFMGKKLSRSFSNSDIAFRYGGEEFLVILTNTNINDAYKRMEVIRNDLKSSPIFFDGTALPTLTVSIGIAEVPLHGKTIKRILQSADHALYVAKEAGRDKVVCFNIETTSDIKTT